MSAIALELLFILVLILANGLFALSEIAIVSARSATGTLGERGK